MRKKIVKFHDMRKVIQRLWLLPYRTHSRLLPFISGLPDEKVRFATRFMKHFEAGLLSKNEVVSTVFKSSLCNVSRLGNNVRHFCFKYDINQRLLHKMSVNDTRHTINCHYANNVHEEDSRIGAQINELCIERDSYNVWVLERSDINDIIHFLCTM